MSIEFDIIKSVYDTLFNNVGLRKYINSKTDIYKGFPTNEQNKSKNLIIIESDTFVVTNETYISSTQTLRQFESNILVFVGFTQETKQDDLQKFLTFTAEVSNAIDLSTYIIANKKIKRVQLTDIKKDYQTDRLMFRQAEISYKITGDYITGTL